MDVFTLSAKIVLDSDEYERQLGNASKKTSGFADMLKGGFAAAGGAATTVIKGTATALGAAATAVTALGKASVEGYSEYEQLVGGVETLFENTEQQVEALGGLAAKAVGAIEMLSTEVSSVPDASKTIIDKASDAFKTAGLSANDYMETVTSFSASLLQSLGGDTNAAADYADQAITDMADNANKMGSSMESIQNAYQGFAKQNYTMLDNLKLGYGGTKEEMERLLADAEKLSGQEFDISSYADVIEAIHIVQTEMGITGTTAKEAASTISGSAASMKAAWENFLTGMADPNQDFDKLTGDLLGSVVTFADNLIPRIQEMLPRLTEGLATLATGLLPYIPETLNMLLPTLVDGATSLINGVTDILPDIITTAVSAIPQLLEAGASIISNLVNSLFEAFPMVLEAGGEVLNYLVGGIAEGLPELIPAAMDMILKIADTLTKPDTLDNILDAALKILIALAVGLEDAIPQLVDAALTIIERLMLFLSDPKSVVKITGAALQIVVSLAAGLVKAIPRLVESAARLTDGIRNRIKDADWEDIGKNVVNGIWDGLKQTWKNLVKWFEDSWDDLVGDVKDLLGIHSPSRVFASIGGFMAEGLGEGWAESFGKVRKQIEGGLKFNAGTVDFSTSGLSRNAASVSSAVASGNSRPIIITVQSVLDGKVIGETSYRYNKNREGMYGTT